MKRAFKKGDQLICLAGWGYGELRPDRVYTAVSDQEPGIFEDRPYIKVTADHLDKPLACHAARFVPYDGSELTRERIDQLREQWARGEL